MRIKVEQILLLFLVSLSFFRVDLAGRNMSFLMSPPLFMSVVIIITFFLRIIKKGNISRNVLTYSGLLLLMLLYFLATIFISYHGTLQIKRFFLFSEIILSAIAFLFLFDQFSISKKREIVRKWIKYSILTHLIWISFQVLLFVNGYHYYSNSSDVWKFVNPLPHTVGTFIPRLEGGFLDPNVCGFYFSFLFFLGKKIKLESRKNDYLLILFVFLTISRSAIAALLICLFLFRFNILRFPVKKLVKGIVIFIGFIISSILTIRYLGFWDKIVTGIVIRFTDKGSSSIHNSLIELGINESFKSVNNFFLGNGFSSSPYFAYDLLKGIGNQWKYANFHSEYVSLFFETGFLGFLFYYFILFFPFIYYRKIRIDLMPILLLILLQGIFYQQYNFHYYWVLMAVVLSLNLKDDTLKVQE